MPRILLAVGMILLALVPSARLAWQARDMPHLGHYHDDSIYWVTAKSLAAGDGYRIVSLPEQPHQTKYPPLYPLLLSVIWKLNPSFPENLSWSMCLAWLFVPVFVITAQRARYWVFVDGDFYRESGSGPIMDRLSALRSGLPEVFAARPAKLGSTILNASSSRG